MADEKAINIKQLAQGRKNIYVLALEDIHVDEKWNERDLTRPDVKEHIEGLALSISKIGVQQALTVVSKGGKVFLTDGYCRMAAAKIAVEKYGAALKGVPCIVEERGTGDADHVLSMLTRNDGLALTMAEQARVIKRLLAFGWDANEIKERTGRSITHIQNCIALLEADAKIMKHLDSGRITGRFALKAIKDKGDKALEYVEREIEKAKAKGKGKATNRTANKSKGKGIQWAKHGPEFFRNLELLDAAYEAADSVPDEIGDIVNWYRGYKEDHKLEAGTL